MLPLEAPRISFNKKPNKTHKEVKIVKAFDKKILLDIIKRLENQERNIDIARELNVSLSTVESINGCRTHTNLHNYKNNIRNENKPANQYRAHVLNEYIEHDTYYELHIINTHNVEAFSKIDKEDYPRISQYKWTLSIHDKDIRVIASSTELHRIGLHQFILANTTKDVIDHINRNPLDNRKANLRITSRSVNSTNAKERTESKSGIRGVYKREARPGIAKASWVCEWSDGKRHSKSFSIDKYGEDEAFRLACSFRENKLKEMKIQSGPLVTEE